VVTLLGLRLAAKAVELMEQDEDDLFFEQGQTRTEFLNALVRRRPVDLLTCFVGTFLCVHGVQDGLLLSM
jgi:hypothetical protein